MRLGRSSRGWAGLGMAGGAWLGGARLGTARRGIAWQAGQGKARRGRAGHGAARHGKAWQAWRGKSTHGKEGLGIAWQARHGRARQGLTRPGVAGHRMAGLARQARRGMAWQGRARHGRHGSFFVSHHCFKGSYMSEKQLKQLEIKSIAWKRGVPNRDIDPAIAYDALEAIRKKHGALTDDIVLAAAANRRNPLHGWFTWDDSAAAAEHRRNQARHLLRSLEVTYSHQPDEPVRVYSVQVKQPPRSEERTTYSTTEEVMRNPATRDALIAEAIRAAMDFRRRFKGLHEMQAVIEAMEAAIERAGKPELAVN